MHLGVMECPILFWGHCDIDLWPLHFKYNHVWSIISCIISGRNPKFCVRTSLGSRSAACCFGVTVTLTAGLSSRTIVSGGYLILFQAGIPKLVCRYILGLLNEDRLANSVDPDEMPYYEIMYLMEGKWLHLTSTA